MKCECVEGLCSKSLGKILYLIDGDFCAASDCREILRRLGDLRIECGISDSYSIVPLDYLISEVYIV